MVAASCATVVNAQKRPSAFAASAHREAALQSCAFLIDWLKTKAPFWKLEETPAGERWVVDGNYRQTRDVVWPRATAIVWLNFGFPTVFARALRRTLRRVAMQERLFAGNRETLWRTFATRESLLWWVITSYRRRMREFRALRASGAYPALAWYELTRPRETARFLAEASTTPL